MMQHVIQTLMGALGAVGFAILFNVRGKRLILFFLGGALDWAVYLICTQNGCSMFVGLLFATMTAAISSEILARIIRTPVLLSLVPMLIPLIPGGSLYYTMNYALNEQWSSFISKAFYTLELSPAPMVERTSTLGGWAVKIPSLHTSSAPSPPMLIITFSMPAA